MVYGGRPKTMVASDADYSFALVAGTCEQANANGIRECVMYGKD